MGEISNKYIFFKSFGPSCAKNGLDVKKWVVCPALKKQGVQNWNWNQLTPPSWPGGGNPENFDAHSQAPKKTWALYLKPDWDSLWFPLSETQPDWYQKICSFVL